MKRLRHSCIAALAATAALVGPAAWAVDFEDVDPSIFEAGESFVSDGYTASVFNLTEQPGGLNGGIVNGAMPTCFTLSCPENNATHYFAGLNDGALSLARTDAALFSVSAFDASYVSPIPLGFSDSVARITLNGLVAATGRYASATFDLLGADSFGKLSFNTFSLAGTALDGVLLSNLSVNACLIGAFGTCSWPAGNQAQFALDNLAVAAVPEPTTWMLMGMGLLAIAGQAWRRKS